MLTVAVMIVAITIQFTSVAGACSAAPIWPSMVNTIR